MSVYRDAPAENNNTGAGRNKASLAAARTSCHCKVVKAVEVDTPLTTAVTHKDAAAKNARKCALAHKTRTVRDWQPRKLGVDLEEAHVRGITLFECNGMLQLPAPKLRQEQVRP